MLNGDVRVGPSARGGTMVQYDTVPCRCGERRNWFNSDVTRIGLRVIVSCPRWRPWNFWRHDTPDLVYVPHPEPDRSKGETLVLEGRLVRLPVPPF